MKHVIIITALILSAFSTVYADDIYVANAFSNSVTPIDGVSNSAFEGLPVGLVPQEVAASPKGDLIYVSSWSSHEIVVINPRSRVVQNRIPLTCSPSSIAVLPSGTEAISVCRTLGQLARIDLVQMKQIGMVPVSGPHSVAVNPSGSLAYVSRSMFSRYVDVFDLATWKRTASIPVDRSPQGLAVSPDGKTLYVANAGAASVSVIDTATNSVKSAVAVGSSPRNVAVSPDGATLYVTNYTSSTVSVIDTAELKVTATVTVGVNPHGIAVDSSGNRLYVTNYTSNNLSVIDTKTLQTVATVQTGIGPLGVGLAKLDQTPPETVAALTGSTGLNNWYLSSVNISLSSNDADSGVKEIRYSVDGAAEVITSGSSASLLVDIDGAHTVSYYAVDNAGNVEPTKNIAVNIDRTAPEVSVYLNRNILWPPNHKMVDVSFRAIPVDPQSGIVSLAVSYSDEYGIYNGTVSGLEGIVSLEAWRKGNDIDGRIYTITAVATDSAGNTSTAVSQVIVPHDMR